MAVAVDYSTITCISNAYMRIERHARVNTMADQEQSIQKSSTNHVQASRSTHTPPRSHTRV